MSHPPISDAPALSPAPRDGDLEHTLVEHVPDDAESPVRVAPADLGDGTLLQPLPASPETHDGPAPPPALDLTARQDVSEGLRSKAISQSMVQRLSDRLLSDTGHGRMETPGYKMVRPLGQGTYGAVWLAEEENTGIRVAIKFFAHGAGQQWQMLQDEVKQLAALDGASGIVHLKKVVAGADPPYYVMSLAEQGSLAKRLEKGPLPFAEALDIFEKVVQALAYVHAHGIRHCDLKPGNILLDQLGQPLVADFGQAHLSNDASPALGTFFYMAPEQADLRHTIPDTRWDVYGLGALLYAMLTGQPPRKDSGLSDELGRTVQLDHRLRRYRDGINATAKPTAHRRVRGVDRLLAGVIDRCLELDPRKRLSSAEAILQALARRRRLRRQRPLLAFGLAAPLLVVLLMFAAGLAGASREINASRDMLAGQVRESDRVTAELAGNGLEKGLSRRIDILKGFLSAGGDRRPRLVAAAAAARAAAASGDPAGEGELKAYRAQLKQWLKDGAIQSGGQQSFPFSRFSVVSQDGYILMGIARDEGWEPTPTFEDDVRNRNWGWRDWFSGAGNRVEGETYDPVAVPHISQPYRSTSGKENEVIRIDVSVPVRIAGESNRQVGLLVGSISWKEFQEWLEKVNYKDSFVVVFNDRGQFLTHGHDDVLKSIRDYRDNPPNHEERLAEQLRADSGDLGSYRDPFDGGEYLAGYKTFDPYGTSASDATAGASGRWGVMIQHEKTKALRPVDDLRQSLTAVGLWVLVGAGVLIGAIWACLIWLLRREERSVHG